MATAKAAATATPKLTTRLSKCEKRNRKRMAEIGAVYDAAPVVRTSQDVITGPGHTSKPGPVAAGKWLTAGVEHDTAHVISAVFDEAHRRDPDHTRTWIALVDGNNQQIDRIRAEARHRGVTVHIICDFIHVIAYLWRAAWCFFPEGDTAAETWVEGACRHLVKDRMDITGARWGLPGAEAILKLRAVVSNGDFDTYWAFHLRQEQQRVHLTRYRHDFTLAA